MQTTIEPNPPSARRPASPRADDVAMLAQKKATTPHEFAQWLSGLGEFYWWERGKFWMATTYPLMERVLKGPEFSADRSAFFLSRMPDLDVRLIGDFFGVVTRMMVMSDAPKHQPRRACAGRAIGEALLHRWDSAVTTAVHDLIAECSADGFEFASQIAEPLPSRCLAELFSIPVEDRAKFYEWSFEMTQFFGGASAYQDEDGRRVNKCAVSLREYFQTLFADRRVNPRNDMGSRLVELQAQFGLDDDELVSQAVMTIVAGQVTTTDQLCNDLYAFLEAPERWARLVADRSLFPTAIEEANRWDPAVTFLFRTVREAVEVEGHSLSVGDTVFVSAHAVNRDASVFAQPEEFRLDRSPNPHSAYGHGSHHCLGARLARKLMEECFTKLADKFPNLQLAGPAVRRHRSLAFSGFEALPLRSRIQ